MPDPRPEGARGFDERYWTGAYDDPDRIDGVFNAGQHAVALKATFDIVEEPIASLVDLGCGLGHLLHELLQAFEPYKALAVEPSAYALERARARVVPPEHTKLRWDATDLASWCRRPDHPSRRFDLGVCNSVLQYLDDDECRLVVPVLARRVRWLYLAVPTDAEYDHQRRAYAYEDPWAIRRPVAFYRELLAPWFDRIGLRLLESKERVDVASSPFWDELYRGW